MKKWMIFLALLSISVILTSCEIASHSAMPSTTNSPFLIDGTAVPKSETTQTTTGSTIPATQVMELDESYTVRILRGDFPVYVDPGYEYEQHDTIKTAGVYTITAEFVHPDGTLWGRLKSGVGWVDLSAIKEESNVETVVTALHADNALLSGGNYHYYNAEPTEFGVMVTFRTNTLLYDVSFFEFYYNYSEAAYESGPELYRIDHLDSSKPLVVRVSFPGVASAWGLKFTDINGNVQTYILQNAGGAEENKDQLLFRQYTQSYKPYREPVEDSNDQQVNLAPWQLAYLAYIETLGDEKYDCSYRLVYVDSDIIPELFISGSCEASGSRICTYKNGRLIHEYLRRLGGASYIPVGGLVFNCNGNMGCYTTVIYQLTDSGFVCLFNGLQEDTYEDITNEDGQYDFITHSKYYIYRGNEAAEVTSEEYFAAQAEIYDFNTSEALYYYNDSRMYSYNAVKQLICDW